MSSERCPLPPGECCRDGGSEQAASWPECTGPRVSMGGLQRSGGLPPKAWSSCPLPADASSAPSCCEGLNEVLSGLFIASGRAAARLGDLHAAKVTHVVNAAPSVELCWHQQHLEYLCVDVLDGPEEPICQHFKRVIAFVDAARAQGGAVLVHCHGGVSRAAALVLAYLIEAEGLGYEAALELLRAARPVVAPNPGFVDQLRAFAEATQARALSRDNSGRLNPHTPEGMEEKVAAAGANNPFSPSPALARAISL